MLRPDIGNSGASASWVMFFLLATHDALRIRRRDVPTRNPLCSANRRVDPPRSEQRMVGHNLVGNVVRSASRYAQGDNTLNPGRALRQNCQCHGRSMEPGIAGTFIESRMEDGAYTM